MKEKLLQVSCLRDKLRVVLWIVDGYIFYQLGKQEDKSSVSTQFESMGTNGDKEVFLTSWKLWKKEKLQFVGWWLLPVSNNNINVFKKCSLWITLYIKRSLILRVSVCFMPLNFFLKNLMVGYTWWVESCVQVWHLVICVQLTVFLIHDGK